MVAIQELIEHIDYAIPWNSIFYLDHIGTSQFERIWSQIKFNSNPKQGPTCLTNTIIYPEKDRIPITRTQKILEIFSLKYI